MSATAALGEKLRARRRKRTIRIASIAAVAAVVLALLGVAWFTPVLAVDGVEVRGAERLDAGTVARAVQESAGGRPLPAVLMDSAGLEADLIETFPAIREITVAPAGPRAVRVTLEERVPVAAVSERGGGFRLLDAEGVDLGASEKVPRGIARVTLAPDTAKGVVAAALSVLGALPPELSERVKEVGAKTPESIELKLEGGVTVRWGSAEDNDRKAEVVGILLKGDPKVIDVTVPSRPATEG